MEMYPEKHLFTDDFFVESMVDARRVLNHPEKLTVDQPLQIPLDQPWEKKHVRLGRVNFDKKIGIQCYGSSPEIHDNIIRSSNIGIEYGDKSSPMIIGNRVMRCNSAIHTNGSTNPIIQRNTITDSRIGAVCRTVLQRSHVNLHISAQLTHPSG